MRNNMKKSFLLTTDGSRQSLKAARYIGNLFGGREHIEITVIHIQPSLPPVYTENFDQATRNRLKEYKKKAQKKSLEILNEVKEELLSYGFSNESIRTESLPRRIDIARDIVEEQEKGLYDSIIMGRHGTSKIQQFFMGSVSQKVLHLCSNHPVCIVDGRIENKKILVPVDDSDTTKNLIEFIGYIFSDRNDIKITLLHIKGGLDFFHFLKGDPQLDKIEKSIEEKGEDKIVSMFNDAFQALNAAGIPLECIETKIKKGRSVAGSILDIAEKEDYGTIIIGRLGASRPKKYLMGGISLKVAESARNCSVWIVP